MKDMYDEIGRQACINIGMQQIMGTDEDSAQKTNPNDLVMGTLTKREFIAAMAFSGMAANVYSVNDTLTQKAVYIADMLIEELDK